MTLDEIIKEALNNVQHRHYHYRADKCIDRSFKIHYGSAIIHDDKLSSGTLCGLLNDAYNRGKNDSALSIIKRLLDLEIYVDDLEDSDLLISLNQEELRSLTEKWSLHLKTCLIKDQKHVRVELGTNSSSGLGITTTAKCDCGFEMDVTDYGAW